MHSLPSSSLLSDSLLLSTKNKDWKNYTVFWLSAHFHDFILIIMGCSASSTKTSPQKQQRNTVVREEKAVSFALLGCGDVGKSTFFKQYIHYEKTSYPSSPEVTLYNFYDAVILVLQAMQEVQGVRFSPNNKEIVESVKAKIHKIFEVDERLLKRVKALVITEEFKSFLPTCGTYARYPPLINGFCDNFHIYCENMLTNRYWGDAMYARMNSFGSESAEENVLQPCWGTKLETVSCRIRTSGIVQDSRSGYLPAINDYIKVDIFDTGGQRAERRKWPHILTQTDAFIYVASLSEYDQVLCEDNRQNRMIESLNLFEEISAYAFKVNVPIFLVLNKKDVFERKLREGKIPLNISGLFPDAPHSTDPAVGEDWIANLYVQRATQGVNQKGKQKPTRIYFCNSLQEQSVKDIVDSCIIKTLEFQNCHQFDTVEFDNALAIM
jgi:GTPase SAR1 family protein